MLVYFDEKTKCVIKLKPSKRNGKYCVCKCKCNRDDFFQRYSRQPSRLDSCKIAIQKAKQFQSSKIKNSVAASDAFFPFADGINTLIKAGVKTIIQPGGSMRDQEIINAANKAKIKMLFTGIRHFNH